MTKPRDHYPSPLFDARRPFLLFYGDRSLRINKNGLLNQVLVLSFFSLTTPLLLLVFFCIKFSLCTSVANTTYAFNELTCLSRQKKRLQNPYLGVAYSLQDRNLGIEEKIQTAKLIRHNSKDIGSLVKIYVTYRMNRVYPAAFQLQH